MITDNWRSKYLNQISVSESAEFATLVKAHSEVAKATFLFFENENMVYVPVPGTTGSSSSPMEPGSDSAPVVVEIGGKRNLLVDSAQFHLEYACRSYKNGCFYYGHSYRDEEPDERHLSQFSHAEAEIIGTLEDIKLLVERYIRNITELIWNRADNDFKDITGMKNRVESLLNSKSVFKSMSFSEVYSLLEREEGAFIKCDKSGYRLTAKGERKLLEKVGEFVWVEKWDKMAVPFYQANDKESSIAYNADLLFGIGEVVGAGQRHLKANELESAIDEHGLKRDAYKWYIEMKNQYPVQTSGFGMGVERYLMWLLGLKDIRSVEIFPRDQLQRGAV